jgi:hypothetical protein
MSTRLWPAKHSILPVLPTTAVTARLNLNCHKLNHPTKVQLWKDQLADDDAKTKVIQEHVLSRRKDHTIPTRWSLYRPLIRYARQLDNLFANQVAPSHPSTSDTSGNPDSKSSLVIVRDVRSRWKRNRATQGYQRVRDWLSLEYKASVISLQLVRCMMRISHEDLPILVRFLIAIARHGVLATR